jgi:hypothetical protein
VSVEAITWALNLAPVPADSGGKPNSACAFVLVGLANHAAPDGTGAFPSVETLVRYTRLSERTVRTALDRLERARVITPCAPEIIAARIRRADRRPQGWDLDVSLIRDDLTDAEIAGLERQFPGLRERIAAARSVQTSVCDGVQQLHPVSSRPVDTPQDGVQRLHLVEGTGCNQRANGVQPTHSRGAAVAPEPSIEPSVEPPAACARVREIGPSAGENPAGGGNVGEFYDALGLAWPLSAAQRDRLTPTVAAAVGRGWRPADLAAFVGANTSGVRSPYAVLAARLTPDELPEPPTPVARRKPWCGNCDEQTRFLLDEFGYPSPRRCPDCGVALGMDASEGR